MNPLEGWLFIIGTPARAKKLRSLLDRLPLGHSTIEDVFDEDGHVIGSDMVFTPPMCPSLVLFGARESARLYANPLTRPALDAWDMEFIGKEDIRRLCLEIERGRYTGPAHMPLSQMLSAA